MSEEIQVTVCWATSAGDFIPFTVLPAKYHGKVVKLVIVGESETPLAEAPKPKEDLFR